MTFCSIDGRPLIAVDHDPLIGEVVDGRYKVVSAIGHGGMGRVYYAEHTRLNKPFALKFLLGDLTQNQEMVKRFRREAESMSRLNHPHCVSVSDFGENQNGHLYLAMEYLEGQDLAKMMRKEGPIDPRRAAKVARQVCEGLEEAHSQGIVHRDLKPENIMLVRRGSDPDFVKILDFGLAKLLEQSQDENGTALTSLGIVHGTPPYMSPEQANGDTLDGRSDLYSLGVILFQMATGRLPFEKPSAMEVMLAHVRQKPPKPREFRPDIPPALESLILRSLEKNRDDRFATARDMAKALQTFDDAFSSPENGKIDPPTRQNRPVSSGSRPIPVQEPPRRGSRSAAGPTLIEEVPFALSAQDELATVIERAPVLPIPNRAGVGGVLPPNGQSLAPLPPAMAAETKTSPAPPPVFVTAEPPKIPLPLPMLVLLGIFLLAIIAALVFLLS
jgi:serine/threonine-protein kinase